MRSHGSAGFSNVSCWRNLRLQQKSAFSRLTLVHGADLKGPLRVRCYPFAALGRMAAIARTK
jgi:hypothetical protein